MRKLLLERFGSAEGVLAASPAEIRSIARVGNQLDVAKKMVRQNLCS